MDDEDLFVVGVSHVAHDLLRSLGFELGLRNANFVPGGADYHVEREFLVAVRGASAARRWRGGGCCWD